MTSTCRRIGTLVTRVQEAYLETPGLALTLHQAARRFRTDAVTSQAILDLLVEAGALTAERGRFLQRIPGGGRGARLAAA